MTTTQTFVQRHRRRKSKPKLQLSLIARSALDYCRLEFVGCEKYLTNTVRRALVAQAVASVMSARYEVEAERSTHTNPNEYVDAIGELEVYFGLRPA